MILNILKRDLKRKKAMNFILFLLIILTSTFLASSINDLMVSMGAIDQFLEKANVPGYTILSMSEESNDRQIENWLANQETITNYVKEEQVYIVTDSLEKEDGEKYKISNSTVFTKIPKKYNKVFNMEDESLELKPGEVAIPLVESESNNLNIGDKIKFTIGEDKDFYNKTFCQGCYFWN